MPPSPKRSTRNAWQSTLARSFMHRRLWLNDPDCLMLRTDETELLIAYLGSQRRHVLGIVDGLDDAIASTVRERGGWR